MSVVVVVMDFIRQMITMMLLVVMFKKSPFFASSCYTTCGDRPSKPKTQTAHRIWKRQQSLQASSWGCRRACWLPINLTMFHTIVSQAMGYCRSGVGGGHFLKYCTEVSDSIPRCQAGHEIKCSRVFRLISGVPKIYCGGSKWSPATPTAPWTRIGSSGVFLRTTCEPITIRWWTTVVGWECWPSFVCGGEKRYTSPRTCVVDVQVT